MKLAAAFVVVCMARGQTPQASAEKAEAAVKDAALLQNTGKPLAAPFTCTDDDMQWAGMSCSEEEPCPVYLELTAIEGVGNRIIVLGNIHTETTTLYSVLLSSEDAGITWREPYERRRGDGLDHIQMVDFQNGWISGETLVPVARDPFFLITSDGGKSWRLRPVVADGMTGAIQQFHFDSVANGAMVIDRRQSEESARYELYETPNGGETWMIRRTSDRPIPLPHRETAGENSGWRIRADARAKAFVIEKRAGEKWTAAASFLVEIGSCKPTPRVLPPPPEPEAEPPSVTPTPPTLKKPRPKS